MARPSRKTEIKERVLAAALELTAEGGFQQSPMSKLAQVAGVSVGTIYLYFPSKDELIAALFEDIRQQMQESILNGYDPSKDVHTRFDTLFMNLSRYYLSHKRHFVFIDQFGFSSFNKSLLDSFSEKSVEAFLQVFNDGVKVGLVRPIDLDVCLSLCHGPILELIKKHHSGFTKVTPESLEQLKVGAWMAISTEAGQRS